MAPGGWGRRFASNVAKLEDDELFKAIGGQLEGANIDYSEWQRKVPKTRTGKKRHPVRTQHPTFEAKHSEIHSDETPSKATSKDQSSSTGSVLSRLKTVSGLSSPSTRRGMSDSSSTCHVTRKKTTSIMCIQDKKLPEHLKVIQLRIQARKQRIDEYEKRKIQLLAENMKLKNEIESEEAKTHFAVKSLLRKYEKYRGGIGAINKKFEMELEDAKLELDITRNKCELGTQALEEEVDEKARALSERQRNLHVLVDYKDKVYPVKALRITELQKELVLLHSTNNEEKSELQRIINVELDKLMKSYKRKQKIVSEEIMQTTVDLLPANLKEMEISNMAMEKELVLHSDKAEEVEQVNAALEVKVESLKGDPKTNVRLQMFPELFRQHKKCTPDMDVILDIPMQQWLPI